MCSTVTRQEALSRLRGELARKKPSLATMIEAGPRVRAQFQPLFKPENLSKLTREDFLSFLLFRNNQHWVGLHRKGPEICSDMDRLRAALDVLLDESRPIQQRLDELQPRGPAAVSGMGRAIMTAILLVMYPEKYGVWNNRSQASMEALELWPTFERGESFGRRYVGVNTILLDIARELGVDLWTLDGLWWAAFDEEPTAESDDPTQTAGALEPNVEQSFGLERHLHDFLRDNWEKTELGKQWDLYVEDGELVGYEYRTPVGKIDLLARHKNENRWLVVELKRAQTSDDTVGQVLRYMGYVRTQIAEHGGRIEGLIVAQRGDDRIQYAMAMVPNLSLMVYEVDFRLKNVPGREAP